MKTFDEIFAMATSPLHREYAETFTDPHLSWGVGVTQGVAVAMQEAKAEIDALKAQNADLLAAQQWQPIQSAPTNQRVLIIDEFLEHQAVASRKIGGHWKTHSNTPEGVWRPKFWQPLPPPPALAKARGDL